ncbi:hypothetical protein GOV12_08235 [Candidatus Pacearchaeota archaeon]|nr:hypothetical protein [Candidatus Pacearchaeota archaeon]
MKDKKGVYFSSDALIALVIILMTVIIAYPVIKYSYKESEIESDVLKVLSSLKIGEIDNAYVKSLINSSEITNLDNSVLEQIGEFYVENLTLARLLADSVLQDLDTKDNIGIWFGNTLITSKNSSPYDSAKHIEVDRQLISGISEGESVTGYSARAYLSSEMQSKYFYFGGYLGDGNISVNMSYSGNLSDIFMEIATNKDFDIYINGNYSGHYTNSSTEFIPAKYDLSAYRTNFHSGDNIIELISNSTMGLYVAGGYLRIIFDNSSIIDENGKYKFPGIEGVINLYDGFYVPGTLNEMSINLHLLSNYSIFLNIGNVTVFNETPFTEQVYEINNSYLSSILNYSNLDFKTTPIRVGLGAAKYYVNFSANVSIFSVTPLPSSFNSVTDIYGNNKAEVIRYAHRIFLDTLFPFESVRIGLSGVGKDKESQDPDDFHNLSRNYTSLNNTLNNWNLKGGTCLCCGIINATNILLNQSDSTEYRYAVIMSDNEPTGACISSDATQDAIDSACDAFNNHGIIFDTIGLGNSVGGHQMLQEISNCSNGTYYLGNYTDLAGVYKKVAENLVKAIFIEQTAYILDENGTTFLFPDSYIKFNYTKTPTIYGLVNTFEKQFFNSTNANFSLPENSTIVETRVVSYSGPRWTDNVYINNNNIFNLSRYDTDYIKLGDPYSINIPNSEINQNNEVVLTTGLSPDNSTVGSEFNKIIYKLIRNISTFTPILPKAEGCIWNIEFEDTTTSSITVPDYYFGTDLCFYEFGNMVISDNNDAIEQAVFELLKLLDLDNDGRIDLKLTEENLVISSSQIDGIPYTWSTQVQVRRWV